MELPSDNTISVRAGKEEDCEVMIELTKGLAETFEGKEDLVKTTAEDYRRDAFHSSPPLFYTVMAEFTPSESTTKVIVGYALYYKTYSTWSGQAIHLDDLFVRPEYRCKGVAEQIMKYLAKIASENNYARISWLCIDWNKTAIRFYEKHGAENVTVKEHLHSYKFSKETLRKLASNGN